MSTHNQPVPFRAPDITLNQLKELKIKWGENRSQVIIRCIERAWLRETSTQEGTTSSFVREDQHNASAT